MFCKLSRKKKRKKNPNNFGTMMNWAGPSFFLNEGNLKSQKESLYIKKLPFVCSVFLHNFPTGWD